MAKTYKWTAAEFVRIVKSSDGTIAGIAEIAGCSHQTVRNYRDRYRRVQKAIMATAMLREAERAEARAIRKKEIDERRERILDAAEDGLELSVLEGEAWAVKLACTTLGREAYSTRTEVAATTVQLPEDALKFFEELGTEPQAAIMELIDLMRAEREDHDNE